MSIIKQILFERTKIATGFWNKGELAPLIELVCGPATFAKITNDRMASELLTYSPDGIYLLADIPIIFDEEREEWIVRLANETEG